MKKLCLFLMLIFAVSVVHAEVMPGAGAKDTGKVNELNRLAYSNYRDNPNQTLVYAGQALALANKLDYNYGRGEAYRLMGIGNSSLNQAEKAIHNYLIALNFFKAANNLVGEAMVYNNIGNEYQEIDFDKALQFFDQALGIATRLNNTKLIAALNLNMGNVYYRKKQFTSAIHAYKTSERLFTELKDTADLVQSWRNEGVIYFKTRDFAEAKRLLTYAHDQAKLHDLNTIVAGVNLTLTSLYTAENNFEEAEKVLNEGKSYAELAKNTKLMSDYLVTAYEMEFKRQNFKAALYYLQNIYKKDSSENRSNNSSKLTLLQEQFRQQDLQQRTMLELQRQSYNRYRFIAALIVAGLLIIVIALLVGNIKRKAETNKRLTELNGEINYQKDNLDRINHHLEEIIDERTKDLQDKNARLSEYSSYLSHQIRGPIATLKGLLNLEKENLLSQRECLNMMDKCVTDIDEKIIGISDMLHDTENKVV